MIPLTPTFLVAAANSHVGLREEGNNRGPMIDLFLRGVEQEPGQPWCAAFVHHVGFWSHFEPTSRKSSWPLPATASCYMLGEFARRKDVLKLDPLEGDVFLIWSPELVRYAHTGVIARLLDSGTSEGGTRWFDCDTIEGNSNDDGSREGWGVVRRVRRFYPAIGDRFIRWADLDDRAGKGDPLAEPRRVA